MQVINYLFVAIISAFIGMFAMAWYDLDNPPIKEAEHESVNVVNNYYIKYDENYILMPAHPIPPKFSIIQNQLDLE